MIGDILQPTHLIFILVVALLVLGPKRLPEVGRSLGRGLRDFKGALSGEEPEKRHDEVSSSTDAEATPAFDPEPAYEAHAPVATRERASTEHAATADAVQDVSADEPAPPVSPFAALSQQAEPQPAAAAAASESAERPS